MIIKIISVLFINFYILITLIKCDTILFTNSPNHLVNNNNNNNNNNINKNFTSYKLDVPGSTNSITIIEANTRKPILTRKQDDTDSRNPLSNNMLNVQIPDNNDKKTVFAPSLLEKFINEYNIKISSHLTPSSDTIERSQIKRYDTYSDDEADKYGNDNQYQNYPQQPPPRPYQGDRKNPFNQKEGWVTLQAVPWSKSQVAKWKPKADVRPIHSVSGLNIYRDDSSLDSLIYQKDNKYPGEQMLDEQKKSNQYPSPRPSFYDGEKDYELATNRRPVPGDSWKNGVPVRKKPVEKPQIEVASDRWYDYGFKSDLEDIYKKPPPDSVYNDPEAQQSSQNYPDSVMFDEQNYQTSMKRSPIRRPDPYRNSNSDNQYSSQKYQNRYPSNHPNHPASGNGEWVLVSTTKGYQHPKPTHSVPRRMNFDSTPNISFAQVPTNFRAHKSIKLTVLPAKSKNGKLKPMSLSHGGLIEVESSPQTVEDSAANSIKRKVKRKATLANGENNEVQFIQVPYRNSDNKPAVLAAVSAGMVPATMAMLMPMMLGRKKRSLSNDNINVTVTHYLKRL